MGKSSGSPPPAPDPTATANAQAAANAETARVQANLNRVNQYTPTGSLTYSNSGMDLEAEARARTDRMQAEYGAGTYRPGANDGQFVYGDEYNAALGDLRSKNPNGERWSSTTTLSPDQQRLLDLSEQAQIGYGEAVTSQLGKVQGILSEPINFDGLPKLTDGSTSRDAAAAALYGRINPGLEAQRTALDTRLRNQGLTPGSEAWNTAFREYGMTENDARLAVQAQAGAEQQRTYGIESGIRNTALQELLASRSVPLNEASALLSGSQVSNPTFTNAPQVQVGNTDYLGAAQLGQSGQNAAYQSKVANTNANNTAAAGAATAAITAAAIIA